MLQPAVAAWRRLPLKDPRSTPGAWGWTAGRMGFRVGPMVGWRGCAGPARAAAGQQPPRTPTASPASAERSPVERNTRGTRQSACKSPLQTQVPQNAGALHGGPLLAPKADACIAARCNWHVDYLNQAAAPRPCPSRAAGGAAAPSRAPGRPRAGERRRTSPPVPMIFTKRRTATRRRRWRSRGATT